MEKILSWIGIKNRVEEIVAHAIRIELDAKTADELTELLQQDHLLALVKGH